MISTAIVSSAPTSNSSRHAARILALAISLTDHDKKTIAAIAHPRANLIRHEETHGTKTSMAYGLATYLARFSSASTVASFFLRRSQTYAATHFRHGHLARYTVRFHSEGF